MLDLGRRGFLLPQENTNMDMLSRLINCFYDAHRTTNFITVLPQSKQSNSNNYIASQVTKQNTRHFYICSISSWARFRMV